MPHDLQQTIALLARTPSVLDALLRDLPEAWTAHNEGGDTWNVGQVVGHLLHGERNDWMPRARRVLQSGVTRAFEPFDRLGHIAESAGKPLHQLLDEFARARSESLDELRGLHLSQDQLDLQGLHPAFGTVTLSQLLATWAVHDLTHIRQITRILAHQYREAVGPWSEYLGILHRPAL